MISPANVDDDQHIKMLAIDLNTKFTINKKVFSYRISPIQAIVHGLVYQQVIRDTDGNYVADVRYSIFSKANAIVLLNSIEAYNGYESAALYDFLIEQLILSGESVELSAMLASADRGTLLHTSLVKAGFKPLESVYSEHPECMNDLLIYKYETTGDKPELIPVENNTPELDSSISADIKDVLLDQITDHSEEEEEEEEEEEDADVF